MTYNNFIFQYNVLHKYLFSKMSFFITLRKRFKKDNILMIMLANSNYSAVNIRCHTYVYVHTTILHLDVSISTQIVSRGDHNLRLFAALRKMHHIQPRFSNETSKVTSELDNI